MRILTLTIVPLVACGTSAVPRSDVRSKPSAKLVEVDWMNRDYKPLAFEGRFPTFTFKNGRYADTEIELQLEAPTYLDVNGDGARDALLPLQLDEAETASEQGNPRFHTFLVFTMVNGELVHLGDLPIETCGPLRATLDGEWLVVRTTRRGSPEDMCGVPERVSRYRWNGSWFVKQDGDELDGKTE
jgi:hypothetical protein